MVAISLGYNTVVAVFTIELTHGKWRPILGHCLCEIFWPAGHATMGGVVAMVTNMISLERVIALSGVPFMAMWYFMPESPRWLLAKGKKERVRFQLVIIFQTQDFFLKGSNCAEDSLPHEQQTSQGSSTLH